MAKNDYFVIVFQILNYLYECLRDGVQVNSDKLTEKAFNIPLGYWEFIIHHLHALGFIRGTSVSDGRIDISNIALGYNGIDYLFENPSIINAKEFLQVLEDFS